MPLGRRGCPKAKGSSLTLLGKGAPLDVEVQLWGVLGAKYPRIQGNRGGEAIQDSGARVPPGAPGPLGTLPPGPLGYRHGLRTMHATVEGASNVHTI